MKPLRTTWIVVFIMVSTIGAASSFAQALPEIQHLQIRGFKGLNTAAGPLVIKPDEQIVANNITLSNPDGNVGSLSKRLGYDSVSAVSAGYDSIVGLYGTQWEDGRKFLALTIDSAGVGYGGVYVTGYDSAALGSLKLLSSYWNCQNPTSFATFGDVLYAVNGVQKGIYWDGKNARSYPLCAPGEPRIVPMALPSDSAPYDTTTWKISGEYRYAFSVVGYSGGTTKTSYAGIISTTVKTQNGRVLIDQFPHPTSDTLATTFDSMLVYIYRTRANRNPLDPNDTLQYVIGMPIHVIGNDLSTVSYIDSTPDASIGTTVKLVSAITSKHSGLDSLKVLTRIYGSPGFMAGFDAAYTPAGDTHSVAGLFYGIPKQKDTLGVVYVATFMDTINAVESDTSRALFVYNDTANTHADKYMRQLKISLPKKPSGLTGVVTNLYRAHILQIGHDSTFWKWWGPASSFRIKQWETVFSVDTTVVGPFYLVAQIGDTNTTYTDSVRYDSLYMYHQPYRQRTPPVNFSKIFVFDGRLCGIAGSRLYNSKTDSVTQWILTDFTALNESDGDEITNAWSTRTAIVATKNNSRFNIYDDFTKSEVSGFFGCVAPQSHVAGLGGHYYMTGNGIVRETDGPTLERTYVTGLISDRLSMFANMPMSRKQQIVAAYVPKSNKVFFDIPYSTGDTVLIWDELANGWTTATGFSFGGATLYDTSSSVNHVPANTMYFFKRGGRTLYTYGTSTLDNGAYIQAEYRSGPLFTEFGYEQVQMVGLETHGGTGNDGLFYQTLSDKDSVLHAPISFDSLVYTYRGKEFQATPSWYSKIKLYSHPTTAYWTTTVIDGIDIFFKKADAYHVH